MNKADIRIAVVDEINKLLIGPHDGPSEVVKGRISLRYFAGILYPIGSTRGQLSKEDDEKTADSGGRDEFSGDSENPLSLANEDLPSSLGLSFCLPRDTAFTLTVRGGRYRKNQPESGAKGRASQEWIREPLTETSIEFQNDGTITKYDDVLDGSATIQVLKRVSTFNSEVELITVSLTNNSHADRAANTEDSANIENRIYQVGLSCSCDSSFLPYESDVATQKDLEEQILALQYADKPVFAVGHGVSSTWISDEVDQKVRQVSISHMPSAYVNRPIFDSLKLEDGKEFSNLEVINLGYLANPDSSREKVIENLISFVDFYGHWIVQQQKLSFDENFQNARDWLIGQMHLCRNRMLQGVELLKNDEAWECFQLANQAMLLQMDQNSRVNQYRNDRTAKGSHFPIPQPEAVRVDDDVIPYDSSVSWRPFQLAFFLMSFSDLHDEQADYRNLVDLIWFSTGGGKTEAYLFLAAFELIRRRLAYGAKGVGTGVITRYTLRFLTADQFARTGSLICALEKIRRNHRTDLGSEPFSAGLYAGGSVTYTDRGEAAAVVEELLSGSSVPHKFQIDYCPNCGTEIIPTKPVFDQEGELDISRYGVRVSEKTEITCTNRSCLFSTGDGIPIRTVDEDIYNFPPSFLLGTIDKFAMMAFKKQSGAIFKGPDGKCLPPSLIIQDELHLISGPLGTIAAVYETAFDLLIQRQNKLVLGLEIGPKYIASSATVRDSESQIQRLMGRESAIFPPRGLRASDSFYAKDDSDESKARLYIGLMAQGLNTTSSAHWTAAAILQSVRFLADSRSLPASDVDFLWSTVCYCNSKRELGLLNASTNNEILARMRVNAEIQGLDSQTVKGLRKEEVSSQGVKNITETRSNLLIPLTDSRDTAVRDFIPATNMISVGVDINRLGVMMINGQPKTTAEYIQASSRVGRSPDSNGPGLVVTLYSPSKPRDRSHYEHFQAYHETLYRLVEPTSVTPASQQALDRALHAALVICLRHSVISLRNHPTGFNPEDAEVEKVMSGLRARLIACYPPSPEYDYERSNIDRRFEEIVDRWVKLLREHPNLIYKSKSREQRGLLKLFTDSRRDPGLPTMQSMRSVDVAIPIKF